MAPWCKERVLPDGSDETPRPVLGAKDGWKLGWAGSPDRFQPILEVLILS
jgi:hypothetical protein